jgi:hypothetical protein
MRFEREAVKNNARFPRHLAQPIGQKTISKPHAEGSL